MDQTRSRFKNHLDGEMVHLTKNLYISRSDPLYYEKVIQYLDPHSPEAHYRLGQKFEKQGAVDKAVFHYNACRRSYPSPYYFSSGNAIRRLEKEEPLSLPVAAYEPPISYKESGGLPRFWKNILLLLLLLNVVLWGLFFAKDAISTTVSTFSFWGIGKEITYETVDMPFIMYMNYGKPQKEIEHDLYNKALELAKANHGQNIWLYGVAYSGKNPEKQAVALTDETQKAKAFVVAQYNASHDQTVKIRFINADYGRLTTLTEVGANLVRTALEAYISDNGVPPETLDKLAADYPNNYLSFIPNEMRSGSNQITKAYNGDGGWVFDPLAKQISDMFYANLAELPHSQRAGFERFRIVVGKSEHSLQLLSGSTLLMEKTVGLGANNSTPEGSFTVAERVKEPKGKQPNVYGSFALGMGAIAIHGTHDADSIGGNLSLGCIRLTNADIEDLYPYIPKGTNVSIRASLHTELKNTSGDGPATVVLPDGSPQAGMLPAGIVTPNESAKGKVFHWLG
ncbi:L,D-transpeptidase [Paenibacillus agricola]|uniref:L,D-transpeptidase n=1 Tax=Paenibacillus agricola TaxID=2716264 RepID=A0ABX0J699_9BACL|nr:L,D-transpeptidase [Paenibacillus agricola]NHN29604.1 L,D-transpeptidase [Paenibacillus agricola]